MRRRGPLRVAGRGWGEMSDRCDVLFTEPGSLGLRFRPNKQTGAVEIIAIVIFVELKLIAVPTVLAVVIKEVFIIVLIIIVFLVHALPPPATLT